MSHVATTALVVSLLSGCLSSLDEFARAPAPDPAWPLWPGWGRPCSAPALLGVAALPWVLPPGRFVLGLVRLVRRRRGTSAAT